MDLKSIQIQFYLYISITLSPRSKKSNVSISTMLHSSLPQWASQPQIPIFSLPKSHASPSLLHLFPLPTTPPISFSPSPSHHAPIFSTTNGKPPASSHRKRQASTSTHPQTFPFSLSQLSITHRLLQWKKFQLQWKRRFAEVIAAAIPFRCGCYTRFLCY